MIQPGIYLCQQQQNFFTANYFHVNIFNNDFFQATHGISYVFNHKNSYTIFYNETLSDENFPDYGICIINWQDITKTIS